LDKLQVAYLLNDKYGYICANGLKQYGISYKDFKDVGGIKKFCRDNNIKYLENKVVENAIIARTAAILCNEENGYVNTLIMREKYGIDDNMYLGKGGLKKICEASGLNYKCAQIKTDYCHSKEYIISKAKECYEDEGYVKQEQFIKYSGCSRATIRRNFGSFNKMLESAGLPINMKHHYSRDEILEDIQRVIDSYGTVSSTTYRKNGRYAQSSIQREFGTWEGALKELGLKGISPRYGKQKMYDDVRNVYEEYGFISKELICANCEYTYEAVACAFGGSEGISAMLGVDDAFISNKSSGHVMIRNILIEMFTQDGFIEEMKFEWLVNPKTNRQMRMDFYIPSINTCIEYQGMQHYKHTHWFHKDDYAFEQSIYRDNIKKQLCEENNVRLVYITYKDSVTQETVAEKLR